MKKKADEWIASLNDEILGLRHEGNDGQEKRLKRATGRLRLPVRP